MSFTESCFYFTVWPRCRPSPVCIILYLSTDRRLQHMDGQFIRKRRQKYIQNPPEGMTPALVRNMTDSDLLNLHYFLAEDDDLDDECEEGVHLLTLSSALLCPPFGRFLKKMMAKYAYPILQRISLCEKYMV